MQTASRMALSRVHASVKATDVAKLLLLNEHHITYILLYRVWWYPT